jgi:Ca2+-binding RTX toxin-like protein
MVGTPGADPILGTDGPDVIAGAGGDDTIWGRGGNDVICGGGGEDRLRAGHGDDRLAGGPGADFLIGGGGDDTLYGGSNRSSVRIDASGERRVSGLEVLYDRKGRNRLYGGAGVDLLNSGPPSLVDGGPDLDICHLARAAVRCELPPRLS